MEISFKFSNQEWVANILRYTGFSGPIVSVHKLPRRERDYPVHIWGCELHSDNNREIAETSERLPACGVGLTSLDAISSALGEGLERYCFAFSNLKHEFILEQPTEITEAELMKLPLFLSPHTSKVDELAQALLQQKQWISIQNWTDDLKEEKKYLKVPLSLIYTKYSCKEIPSSSNGVAAGPSMEFALLRAIYELIERDAFMISWYHRYPGKRVNEFKVFPDFIISWITRLRELNIEFRIHDISSELGFYVFLGYVVEWKDKRPISFSCGAGCSLDPYEAAKRAFLESALSWKAAKEMVSFRKRLNKKDQSRFKPMSFSDHPYLYQHEKSMNFISYLLEESVSLAKYKKHEDEYSYQDQLYTAIKNLSQRGFSIFTFDMTPAHINNMNTKVVRAIIPGLIPLCWGEYRPLELTRLIKPKWISREKQDYNRNVYPHPFP